MALRDEIAKKNARLVGVVQLGLVGLIAYFLVRALMTFITPESAWTQPRFSAATPTAMASSDPAQYDFSFDPFHRDISAVEIPVDIGDDAPETTLNLKLTGIFAGPQGSANIKTPDNKELAYGIGDEIMPGVTLKSVNAGPPKYAVLSQNGRLERLTFEKEKLGTITAPTLMPNVNSIKLPYSVNQIMTAVDFSPAIENGKTLGYKVTSKNSGIDLSQMGFQNGDIVTRIGNVDMTGSEINWPRLMDSLSQAKSTSVTVIRDGQRMTVKLGTL